MGCSPSRPGHSVSSCWSKAASLCACEPAISVPQPAISVPQPFIVPGPAKLPSWRGRYRPLKPAVSLVVDTIATAAATMPACWHGNVRLAAGCAPGKSGSHHSRNRSLVVISALRDPVRTALSPVLPQQTLWGGERGRGAVEQAGGLPTKTLSHRCRGC